MALTLHAARVASGAAGTRLKVAVKVVAGAAALLGVTVAPAAAGNDFPTQARVEYVLACMDQQGGQNYNTLYGCVCLVDRLAKKYSYAEFVKTQTLAFLYSTPGERGGVFRDGVDSARDRVQTFEEVNEAGRKACFPRHVSG